MVVPGARNTLALECLDTRIEVQQDTIGSPRTSVYFTMANHCPGLAYVNYAHVSFRCERADGVSEELKWEESNASDTSDYALDGLAIAQAHYHVVPNLDTCGGMHSVCMDLSRFVPNSLDARPKIICARIERPAASWGK